MFKLAIRQLLSRKKQISLIMLGIMLGTTTYVTISGMLLGFQEFILQQLVDNNPHIDISARQQDITAKEVDPQLFAKKDLVSWVVEPSGVKERKNINNISGWYNFLDNNENVIAYSPQNNTNAIASKDGKTKNINVIGCNPKKQMKVTTIAKYMTHGKFSSIGEGNGNIIVGSGIAKRLGLKLNRKLTLALSSGVVKPFKVTGIFETKLQPIDYSIAYAGLQDVQELTNENGAINDIAIRLKNPISAEYFAKKWSLLFTDYITSWQEKNDNILSVFKVQDFIRYFISITILMVTAFGIYNILSIVINQKKGEIAILKAIGYSRSDITLLFLIQGLIIGIVGGLIGAFIGYLICIFLSTVNFTADQKLNVSFNSFIYFTGFFMAFLSAAISSMLPAISAGKMTPIEIIRDTGI